MKDKQLKESIENELQGIETLGISKADEVFQYVENLLKI